MHGPHSAVMDCGASDRRPPRQTAPFDVISSSLRQIRRQKLFFVISNQFRVDSYKDSIGVFTLLQISGVTRAGSRILLCWTAASADDVRRSRLRPSTCFPQAHCLLAVRKVSSYK
jgi:hypothetical protein